MMLQGFIDLFKPTKKSPQVVGVSSPSHFIQLKPTVSHLALQIKEVYLDEGYRRFFNTTPFSTSSKGYALAWQDVIELLFPELNDSQIPHALMSIIHSRGSLDPRRPFVV
jgi:hypothetical protein